jgi:hypothetical protein
MEEFKFTEPKLIKAGSDLLRLGLMRQAPKVDCRVLSEDIYQELKKTYDAVSEGKKEQELEATALLHSVSGTVRKCTNDNCLHHKGGICFSRVLKCFDMRT